MLELHNDELVFSFPEVHEEAKVGIEFQRTLRLPEDGREYPLPPGLGRFPLRHVDDHADRVPAKWVKRGGVMLPMYQSEALWVNFNVSRNYGVRRMNNYVGYPFAVKVSAGLKSAVTGKTWKKGLRKKDYCVLPRQPWIDGFCVEEGKVKQFVAAPLGLGLTAEEQLSGKAKFGGIQIEVFPMKAEVFNRRFPIDTRPRLGGGFLRSKCLFSGDDGMVTPQSLNFVVGAAMPAAASMDMGLAAGGSMKQEIYKDPFDFADWDTENSTRVFVHLANSIAWKAITKQDPPTTAPTALDYTRYGLPWFDYYVDDWKALKGTGKLKGLKTLMELGFQRGLGITPDQIGVTLPSDQVRTIKEPRKGAVRDGAWT